MLRYFCVKIRNLLHILYRLPLEECAVISDAAYSEDYVEYIIEYNGDSNDYSNFDVNTVPIIVTDVWSFSEDENEIEIVKAQNIFYDTDYRGLYPS